MITKFYSLQDFIKVYKKHFNRDDFCIEVNMEVYYKMCQLASSGKLSEIMYGEKYKPHSQEECVANHLNNNYFALNFRGIPLKVVNDQI